MTLLNKEMKDVGLTRSSMAFALLSALPLCLAILVRNHIRVTTAFIVIIHLLVTSGWMIRATCSVRGLCTTTPKDRLFCTGERHLQGPNFPIIAALRAEGLSRLRLLLGIVRSLIAWKTASLLVGRLEG